SQGRSAKRGNIGDLSAKLSQRLLRFSLNEVQVPGFPSDVRRGGIRLNGVFQRLGLAWCIPENLIRARQVKPITCRMGVQFNRSPVLLDGRRWITSDQIVVSAKVVAVLRISWIQPRGFFQ